MRGENCENTVALDAQINLGRCVEDGRTGEARQAFEDILELKGRTSWSTHAPSSTRLVNCLIAEGDWPMARKELSEIDTVLEVAYHRS